MSQHLINDFIQRTYIFKPLMGEKIINKKMNKYQASNRKNNTSPQDIEESVYDLKMVKAQAVIKQSDEEPASDSESDQEKRIDITI